MPRLLLIVAVVAGTAAAFTQRVPAYAQPAPANEFAEVRRIAATLPRLHSLVVSHRGEVVFQHYGRGYSATRPANVKSASKSIISALVGIAIDRGLIKSVDQRAADFFPELAKHQDPRKRAITVEHLLTMRSGLESTSGQNYGRWVTSRNWVAHALARPLVAEPGTTMQYSTGTSHILSALLTRVTKTSTWQFANAALGKPLGIQIARWPQDPQGIYFGGNDMLLTPRQMIAIGELYLNEGRVKGQQVVPERWVTASCVPRTSSRFDPGREYGYGWWIDEVGGETACYAWGYGGQFILVFEDIDLVVTATSSVTESDERRGYRRDLLRLIGDQIVQPLARSSGAADAAASLQRSDLDCERWIRGRRCSRSPCNGVPAATKPLGHLAEASRVYRRVNVIRATGSAGAAGDPARGSRCDGVDNRASGVCLTIRCRQGRSVRQPEIVSVASYFARQWRYGGVSAGAPPTRFTPFADHAAHRSLASRVTRCTDASPVRTKSASPATAAWLASA